jgi:BlaI family penicillinase repressor
MRSLNPNELEILSVLWEHGSQKPAEIQQRLSRRVKNSALRWQLEELVKRGHVKRRKQGKAYYYQAVTPRHRVLGTLTRRMAEVFCGGSALSLIGQMIESGGELSDEDLRELRRIAAKKVSARKGSKKKGAKQ